MCRRFPTVPGLRYRTSPMASAAHRGVPDGRNAAQSADSGAIVIRKFLDRVQGGRDSTKEAERPATASTRLRGCNPGTASRRMPEQGWREFLDILNGRTESAGIPLVDVPPAGTSQDGSRCGTRFPKRCRSGPTRCGVCGLELDRDENAARNVLCRGLCMFAGAAVAGGWDGTKRYRSFRSASIAGADDAALLQYGRQLQGAES